MRENYYELKKINNIIDNLKLFHISDIEVYLSNYFDSRFHLCRSKIYAFSIELEQNKNILLISRIK